MSKYDLTTQKKKAAIIRAALMLFSQKGLAAVNMKELATSADVSQASIYNYFGSKEGVVAACVSEMLKKTEADALELLQQNKPFYQKLEQSLIICSQDMGLAISKAFSQTALEDKSLYDLVVQSANQIKRGIYERYIEMGRAQGALDATIPTEIYLLFIDAVNTVGESAVFMENISENTDYIHQLVLHGLLGT